MNRHLKAEQLSAYLDSELGFVEMLEIESHCAACGECSARLAALRHVVNGLSRVERAAPPPYLVERIRREAQAQTRWQMLVRSLKALLALPTGATLRTAVASGLGVGLSLLLVGYAMNVQPIDDAFVQRDAQAGREVVTVEASDQAPIPWPQTTSEVAGREFVWNDQTWVQRGLEGKRPSAHVDTLSPEGRALLAKYQDLGFLLSDGSTVVLRYKLETVELSARSGRILGYESESVWRIDPRILTA